MIKTVNNMKQLNGLYEFSTSQLIGQGGFGKVVKGIEISTCKTVAIKIFPTMGMDECEKISFEKQVNLLKQLDHPSIVQFYNSYEDEKNYYIVLEYLQGGDLYNHIIQKNYYSEKEAKLTLKPIIDAVRYMHQSGVVHRDLKPENCVYTKKNGVETLKIIDFGVSQTIINQSIMSTQVGTIQYMAPEILKGQKYRESIDIWSIGVILYVLLCGFPPFEADTTIQLKEQIMHGCLTFNPQYWEEVSDEAIDLIKKMLEKDPAKRITLTQMYDHPWIKNQNKEKNLFNAKLRLQKFCLKIKNALKVINTMKDLSMNKKN